MKTHRVKNFGIALLFALVTSALIITASYAASKNYYG